ncbi:tripartite tricarboxylate transporter substrate-binding protein [Blastococcus sp. SYSU D00820]
MSAARRTPRRHAYVAGVAASLLVLTACGDDGGSGGDEGETFYAGETLDFVVPFDPGGGYDAYARALAPYLAECLGDGTQVVVRNEPGAGGLLATNTTGAASSDERRIQITNTVGTVSAQIAGAEGVQYDMAEFSMIGRVSAPADSVAVAGDGDIEDFQQMIDSDEPVRFVATGPGSNEYIVPNILSAIYDFPIELVTGFPGSGEARLAVVSGDADAHVQSWDSQLSAVESGEVRSVLLATDEAVEELPDTPTVMDFEPAGDEGETLRDELVGLEATGRGIVAPPGLSDAQLTELRDAFDCAAGNEELAGELADQQRPLSVMPGAEWEELVEGVLDASDQFQQIIADSF